MASSGSRLPIVEPGKKPRRGAPLTSVGSVGERHVVGANRLDPEAGIVAPQPRRRGVEMLARNVDRNVSRQLGQRLDQQPRLDARAAAEFDQRAARPGAARPISLRTLRAGSRSRCGSGNIPAARRSASNSAEPRGVVEEFGRDGARRARQAPPGRRDANSSRSAASARSRESTGSFIAGPPPDECRRTSSARPVERSCDRSCAYGPPASRCNRRAGPSGWP